ncbi:MAG TPA: phospholipase C, phosphocholine-specific [Acidobacteriaceae bacterium]
MQTRRDFLKIATAIAAGVGFSGVFPESIERAVAIDPAPGSSYLDAEHVVVLMQENRSFDHMLGALQGVRGFNDPRAVTLPDDNLVWLQTNAAGETYAPFRLDIRNTDSTWTGSLPHSRESQVDAWNLGNCDRWLDAKRSGRSAYAHLPLTMGHYTRDDIPFYYALADAFTVCDQHFSGAMTSTSPNRSMFWTGTVRDPRDTAARACMRNGDYPIGGQSWMTFPERLQKNGISWKVYQNDLDVTVGMTTEQRSWLSNFSDNPLEWFAQYKPRLAPTYIAALPGEIAELEAEVAKLGAASDAKSRANLAKKQASLAVCRGDLERAKAGGLAALSPATRDQHQRGLSTNADDPDFHELAELTYMDGATKRTLAVPKGDALHQFRADVHNGKLPTVAWLVSSEKFSDHPSAPWYGAWYVSEVMNILTQNPEVWKKTIFILTYDENDGYFDHIPPYVAPNPKDKSTGRVSGGIDTAAEYAYAADEVRNGVPEAEARTAPVGMGFRVPMIVASPWSRGGWVNSQLFDHVSTIQFLERFLKAKFGTKITEENISPWRRSISGDLTSIFRPFDAEVPPLPFLQRDPFVEDIHKAKFKATPAGFHKLTAEEIAQVNRNPAASALIARQEKGARPSCALPYELYGEGGLNNDRQSVGIHLRAANDIFGKHAVGAPFNVCVRRTKLRRNASYTVPAGDSLRDMWPLDTFVDARYYLTIDAPNGFFRRFTGDAHEPGLTVACEYEADFGNPLLLTGNVALRLKATTPVTVEIVDNAYGAAPLRKIVSGPLGNVVVLDLARSFGWYDFSLRADGFDHFEKRYAGRVETGRSSYSDPFMGKVVGA